MRNDVTFFFPQVNRPVSHHFLVTHPIRTLRWLLSQCTTARRSKNSTLSVHSSSLFATSCTAIPGNLHRDRSFLCLSVRSFARSLARSLVRSFVSSLARLFFRSFVRLHAFFFVRSFALLFVHWFVSRLLTHTLVCSFVHFLGLWIVEDKFSNANLRKEIFPWSSKNRLRTD